MVFPSDEPVSPFLKHVESSVQNFSLVSVSLSISPLIILHRVSKRIIEARDITYDPSILKQSDKRVPPMPLAHVKSWRLFGETVPIATFD